ncbi:sulfite exporter TauE/SafE family protein [Spiractinospora alimapuensis]|uniref:sulfite exporter TauE/SafE family protein n=1 Tax=Spiractinospora alimapuensis TaxID=2820884 RepID=UPI001F406582|nr:sulfite exporter TauE/SafE family protein [Spiractinospora alimapuensis]
MAGENQEERVQGLVVLGILGFLAQLVNSSLGMGYGVTSTSFLLAIGTVPALASATVNLSQVGSQAVSALAHWRFGNVDWRVVRGVAVSGALGAFGGAFFLSWLSTEAARPLMTTILLVLGCYVLVRFTVWGPPKDMVGRVLAHRFLAPLGFVGGFMNSTGGGGWGPIGTSALLATGRLEPRKVVGSISVAEFVVVLAGSAGFAFGLGLGSVNMGWVGALLLGGVVAAPIAAWLAHRIPGRMLGPLVGGLILTTNAHNVMRMEAFTMRAPTQLAVYAVLLLAWGAAVLWSTREHLRHQRDTEPARSPAA